MRGQDVSGAPDRVDQGAAAGKIHLSAHPPHQDVDGVRHRIEVVVPDVLENSGPGPDSAGLSHEVLEQREVPAGQLDLPTIPPNTPGGRIELQVVDPEDRRERRRRPPRQGPQPRQQLLHLEWLGEVVVGPGIQALDPFGETPARRKNQHRNASSGSANPAAQLQPVDIRQAEVEHHEVVFDDRERLEPRAARTDDVGSPTGPPGGPAQQVGDLPVILDDQHTHIRRNVSGRAALSKDRAAVTIPSSPDAKFVGVADSSRTRGIPVSMMLIGFVTLASLASPPSTSTQGGRIKVKEERPGLLGQAKISADSAYRLAATRVPGGKATVAELEIEKGRLVFSFDLKVAGTKGIEEIQVDAKTGAVVSVEHETPAAEAKEKKPPKRE